MDGRIDTSHVKRKEIVKDTDRYTEIQYYPDSLSSFEGVLQQAFEKKVPIVFCFTCNCKRKNKV